MFDLAYFGGEKNLFLQHSKRAFEKKNYFPKNNPTQACALP